MTREIAAAAKALKIAVHDHLVIGRGGHASFKSPGASLAAADVNGSQAVMLARTGHMSQLTSSNASG